MSVPSPPGADIKVAAAARLHDFPFAVELSLAPLIAYWDELIAGNGTALADLGRTLRARLAEAPALTAPALEPEALQRHADLVHLLMTVAFPPVFWEQDLAAALVPFQLRPVYMTPAFRRTLVGPDGLLQGRINVDLGALARFRSLNAYALILKRLYGVESGLESPLIVSVPDATTGLDRHFKVRLEPRFIAVEPREPLPPATPAVRTELRRAMSEPARLAQLIPPGSVTFRGFTILQAVDVTDQEVLSSVKRDLIDKESIVSTDRFQALQAKLRTLFRLPDLHLGLAAIEGERVLLLSADDRLEHACIFADSVHHVLGDFAGSVFARAAEAGEPLFVADLAAWPGRGPVEASMLARGFRSLVVAPLRYQQDLIGMLALKSPTADALTPLHGPRLAEVLPLFSMAVKRSLDELHARVQAFIKEKATAIHPVVEWRFRKAVLDGLERQGGAPGELGPIVFRDVYPLYGIADIRGSSTHRAEAIQADLLTQLGLAGDVLRAAHAARHLPILDQLALRLEALTADIAASLRSGDEMGAVAFLRGEVEPLLDHLQGFGPEVRERVEAYRAAVDPALGVVYRRRRAFDESITAMTEAISAYLDLEEQAAQAMFPHYFEKQKTDGVDYSIYVGGSLLETGGFDPLYLKNLRLWQLMVACGIALRAERLKSGLPVALEVANLILVQHAPLAIRFRLDEKRFDVDGAYNVRYEIIKKRIDKAEVRGTGERVTQPGKIAIVYSHPSEAAEWRDHIEYLQRLGYLTGTVETLDLEELPGAQGLRALRVSVDLSRPEGPERPTLPSGLARPGLESAASA
jgi:hypothetical protein